MAVIKEVKGAVVVAGANMTAAQYQKASIAAVNKLKNKPKKKKPRK